MCEKTCFNEKMANLEETRVMMIRSEEGKHGYWRQILTALAVSLGPFAAGLSKGYMSPAIASLQDNGNATFSVSDHDASWIASLSLLGAFFGGMVGGAAMSYGRRTVLLGCALPYALAWLLTSVSTSVAMLSVTSFFGGMLICCITMITQVYVTEIAEAEIRGCLSSVLKILNQIGILISFSMGAYLSWNQLALVVATAPILLFLALLFIPETPSLLLLREKDQEAAESLQWLRGPDSDIRQELATIRTNILASKQYSQAARLRALPSKRLMRPVLITCGLMFFQKFTGSQVLNFYAVTIFRKTFRTMNAHGVAIATSVVQLLASCISGMLIDNVGRLPLLIGSGVMMSIALAGLGSYLYYDMVLRTQVLPFDNPVTPGYDWIPLICILIFTIAFALGISPISSLLVGELFPLEYRSTGSALATSFSYLCGFVNVKTMPNFKDYIGLYGLFWMYAGISVMCLLFVVLFVPETKGRKIDEMDPKYVESLCINR
ncbi:facilitated trehalose transporter Tret1-like [Aricia agestis]|uniref:facilitated trehalose transporter Tret1-like n=1 Tax=Aricia agestis TaxID=91739 RepID=UPI001C20997B|nr:facilitated trehalose transporter Tret1-like [Aricia agestis]